MSDYPNVSVIIPVYNAERTIKNCLNSVVSLNYPKKYFEIIIVNNNSTDKTADILHEFQDSIKVLDEKQRGASAARNRGITASKFDLIAFTDSDCIVDVNWLSEIISPLDKDNVGVAGGRILAWNPVNYIEKYGEIIHDHEKSINYFKPQYAITMNWASRKSVLLDAGLFNISLTRCQDVDMSFKIIQSGYDIIYNPDALVYHRNEKTLTGLLNEGYIHGLWSVKLIMEHKEFLGNFGYKRFNINGYRRLFKSLNSYLRGENSEYYLCDFLFNLGKKFGKIHGSVVNSYLDI